MAWDELSMKERAAAIKVAVLNGIFDRGKIKDLYNNFLESVKLVGLEALQTGVDIFSPITSKLLDKDRLLTNVSAREWGPPMRKDKGTEGIIGALLLYYGDSHNGEINYNYAKALSTDRDYQEDYFYNNIKKDYPHLSEKEQEAILDREVEDAQAYLNHYAALSKYLGKGDLGLIENSPYRPKDSKDADKQYYRFKSMTPPYYFEDVIYDLLKNPGRDYYEDATLNTFTGDRGRDEKGEYVSIYDKWDYNSSIVGTDGVQLDKLIGGHPFEIYDRVYLDDYFDVPEGLRGGHFLPEFTVTPKGVTYDNGGQLGELQNGTRKNNQHTRKSNK